MTDRKDCPWCGSGGEDLYMDSHTNASGLEGWVDCLNCGARGPLTVGNVEPDEMERLIWGDWNDLQADRIATARYTIGSGWSSDMEVAQRTATKDNPIIGEDAEGRVSKCYYGEYYTPCWMTGRTLPTMNTEPETFEPVRWLPAPPQDKEPGS